MKNNLVTYSLIGLILIPIFGFKFLLSFIGNIVLLLLLIPLLILLVTFLSFNSLKSKVNTCNQCGIIILGNETACNNCGANLSGINGKKYENFKKPSETTIEVKAEEIK